MKNLSGFLFFIVLSNVCFAQGTYNSQNGNYVVQNVDVDGQTFFDSVTLNLDIANGTFTIVDAQPRAPTLFTQPIQQVETDGYTIGFLGCARTGEILSSPSGDRRVIDCDIQIINHQSDRLLKASINTPTPILRDNLSALGFAFRLTSGNQTTDRGPIDVLMPQNQPVKFSYRFSLNINSSFITSFKAEFRDINFSEFTNEVEFFDISF